LRNANVTSFLRFFLFLPLFLSFFSFVLRTRGSTVWKLSGYILLYQHKMRETDSFSPARLYPETKIRLRFHSLKSKENSPFWELSFTVMFAIENIRFVHVEKRVRGISKCSTVELLIVHDRFVLLREQMRRDNRQTMYMKAFKIIHLFLIFTIYMVT